MNCMDFFHIVDSRDVNRLSAAERDACEAHAAACRHCAPHWVAFARLAEIPVPSMPREVLVRSEAIAATESRSASKRMAAGRVVVIGAIVALAAAATMVWRMSAEPSPAATGFVPAVGESEPISPEPAPVLVPNVDGRVAGIPRAELPMDTVPRYSVRVMPLEHEVQDPASREPVGDFYAALVAELRKVRGLTLQTAPGTEIADYVLTVTAMETAKDSSGQVTFGPPDDEAIKYVVMGSGAIAIHVDTPKLVAGMLGGDGAGRESAGLIVSGGYRSNDSWPVELKVESGKGGGVRSVFPVSARAATNARQCSVPGGSSSLECMLPEQLAANQVEMLRLRVFPLDPSIPQRLAARLRDASLSPAERNGALNDLIEIQETRRGSQLESDSIQAMVEHVSAQPSERRAQAWGELGRISHPDLVAPLIEALRSDSNKEARIRVLSILEASHLDDPVVRGAIEEAESRDPDEVVRAAAHRALYGGAEWRDLVMANLSLSNLSYRERLDPLLSGLSGGTAVQLRDLDQLLQDPVAVQSLVNLVRSHLHDADEAETTARVLGLLRRADDPLVFDLFIDVIRGSSQPSGMRVAASAVPWVMDRREDPRVRESLESASPVLRETLEQMQLPDPVSRQPALP